jgi:tetratricopeptide (TPR) repeat protein
VEYSWNMPRSDRFQLASFPHKMVDVEANFLRGDHHKSTGNELFKAGDYKGALREYHSAILYLKGLDNSALKSFAPIGTIQIKEDVRHKVGLALLSTHLNMSAVYLKMQNFEKAILSAETVIKLDTKNAKAIYRKGCGLIGLQAYEKAEKVLKQGVLAFPTDPALRKEYDFVSF